MCSSPTTAVRSPSGDPARPKARRAGQRWAVYGRNPRNADAPARAARRREAFRPGPQTSATSYLVFEKAPGTPAPRKSGANRGNPPRLMEILSRTPDFAQAVIDAGRSEIGRAPRPDPRPLRPVSLLPVTILPFSAKAKASVCPPARPEPRQGSDENPSRSAQGSRRPPIAHQGGVLSAAVGSGHEGGPAPIEENP